MNEWEWELLEDKTCLNRLTIAGMEVSTGDRVRLHPKEGGDVLDIALAGQTAVIESLEQDYEGKVHVCVVLDDDPGRDMGLLRQPGHRFFFTSEEIELLPSKGKRIVMERPSILVAGIGNIFLGDDGFGVEVVKRLSQRELPAGTKVADFGIRSFDLVYALQDGYDTTILIDAYPSGQVPGAVSLIEPDLEGLDGPANVAVDAHGMNPVSVLRMAKAMNGCLKKVLLVGCEPASLGGEEGHMGLSEPVEGAVDGAVEMVVSLVVKILSEKKSQAF